MANRTLFRLKKPCANCPFRNDDQAIDLAPGRIEQIASEITAGDGTLFFCHKTLSGERDECYDEDGNDVDQGYQPGQRDSVCAGALIFQLKAGRVPIVARFGFHSGELDYPALEAQFPNIIEPEDVL